jgi:hypothetical protein
MWFQLAQTRSSKVLILIPFSVGILQLTFYKL